MTGDRGIYVKVIKHSITTVLVKFWLFKTLCGHFACSTFICKMEPVVLTHCGALCLQKKNSRRSDQTQGLEMLSCSRHVNTSNNCNLAVLDHEVQNNSAYDTPGGIIL